MKPVSLYWKPEPGAVGQEPSDRDLVELLVSELLEVSSEGGIELDRAPLDQAHDRQGGPEGLGEGGQVEDRVGRHRNRMREQTAGSVRAMEQDVVAAADQYHHARNLAARDGVVGGLVDTGEIRGSGNFFRQSEGGPGE